MASLYNDLLDEVVSQITSLALVFNATPVPVAKAKAAKARDGIDESLPAFHVCPVGREKKEPFCFGGSWQVTYPVQVSLIAAGNLGLTANLDTYLDWRQQVTRLFERPPVGSLKCFLRIDLQPADAVDPGMIPLGFDFSAIVFHFVAIEQR